MWEYTFKDYTLYCDLFKIKASDYKNLKRYKKFLEDCKEMYSPEYVVLESIR